MDNYNPNQKSSSGESWGKGSGGSLESGLSHRSSDGMKPEDIGAVNTGPNQTPHGNKKDGNFC